MSGQVQVSECQGARVLECQGARVRVLVRVSDADVRMCG